MTTSLSPDTFKPLLKALLASPADFSPEQATLAFEHLALFPSAVSEAQVGAFLSALTLSRLDQKSEIVVACAKVMRRYSVIVDLQLGNETVVDIVGTGGDGHDTFNVSTSAAIVAAGAGAIVCKVSVVPALLLFLRRALTRPSFSHSISTETAQQRPHLAQQTSC